MSFKLGLPKNTEITKEADKVGLTEAYSEPCQAFKMERLRKYLAASVVNYICKTFHLGLLAEFYIRL